MAPAHPIIDLQVKLLHLVTGLHDHDALEARVVNVAASFHLTHNIHAVRQDELHLGCHG